MAIFRNIKVLSTLGESGIIETNVTTLAELKPLLSEKGINYSGMKIMVGETRNELNMDDAILPEGDFKLYLMPAKTKSGVSVLVAAEGLRDALDTFIEALEESPVEAKTIDSDEADLRAVASRFGQ